MRLGLACVLPATDCWPNADTVCCDTEAVPSTYIQRSTASAEKLALSWFCTFWPS